MKIGKTELEILKILMQYPSADQFTILNHLRHRTGRSSQIYSELNELKKEGYIFRKQLKMGNRNRWFFSLTDKGLSTLNDTFIDKPTYTVDDENLVIFSDLEEDALMFQDECLRRTFENAEFYELHKEYDGSKNDELFELVHKHFKTKDHIGQIDSYDDKYVAYEGTFFGRKAMCSMVLDEFGNPEYMYYVEK